MSYILELYPGMNGLGHRVLRVGIGTVRQVDGASHPFTLEPRHEEAVKALVGSISDRYGISEARILLPFYLCHSIFLELPLLKRKDIADALSYELEGRLPLPVPDYRYAFCITGRDEGRSRVLVLTVRRDALEGMVSMVEGSGIPVSSVKCAFMEGLGAVLHARKRDCIFIHVEEGEAAAAVVRNNTIMNIERKAPGLDLRTFLKDLGGRYGIPETIVSGDIDDGTRSEMGVTGMMEGPAVGMSLLRRRAFSFEFLDPAARKPDPRMKKYAAFSAGLALFLFMAGYLLPVYRDHALLSDTEHEIRQIREKASPLIEKRKEISERRKRVNFLAAQDRTRTAVLEVMREIADRLPEDAWITGFSMDRKGLVELRGFADDPSQLVEKIEASPLLRNVVFSAPILRTAGGTRFALKMEVEQ